MAESELMTACLPARCDLKMDFITFSTTVRIQAAYLCYLHTNILEGKGWLFFWPCLLAGMRHPQTLWPYLQYLLCICLCQALSFHTEQIILGVMKLLFPSDMNAVPEPGLLLESRVHCAGWSLAGRGGHNGFQESSEVLRAGDQTQLSTSTRAGCLQV